MVDDGPRRVAVVTGAASGIGEAIARGLVADRYDVAALDLAPVTGAWTEGAGGDVRAYRVDVTDNDEVLATATAVRGDLGPVGVLINCAGWDKIQPFRDTDPAFWAKVIDINLLGAVQITHAFYDDIVAGAGRIVNISSDAGRVGSSGETVYAGAKAGMIGFTKSLAREIARSGATANCVCPGPVETPFLMKNPPKLLDALRRSIPMRRFGSVEDVWAAVRFFIAPESSYTTGQTLSVSGGLTMAG